MLLEFTESGCPIFRATTPLSRGNLRSKGHGKLSIHYCADQATIETIFRIIVFANQLSLNGAVANMSEEYESLHDRSGQPDLMIVPSIALSEIKAEVPLENDIPSHQNLLLQRYEERIELLSHTDRVSKFCMDAGFIRVVEIGHYFMTKDDGEQFYAKACREYTLPRNDGSSQPTGWIQGNTKIGPVLEVTTSCLYGKHGVEIRIWCLSEDNTQSWVRISHGSTKFVMNSNNNDTKSPEDRPEEQASQLKVKNFAARSKAKANPQRREPVDYSPSIIPMNERKRLILNQEILLSLRTRSRRKRSIFFDTLKQYNEKKTEQFNSGELRTIFRINFHSLFIGLTIGGKHAWQQEEEQKGDISTALMIQEHLFISELVLLILYYRTMW